MNVNTERSQTDVLRWNWSGVMWKLYQGPPKLTVCMKVVTNMEEQGKSVLTVMYGT